MATFNLCPTIKISSIGSCFKCTKKERRNSESDIVTTKKVKDRNNIVMVNTDSPTNTSLNLPDIEVMFDKQKFKSSEVLLSKENFITDCIIIVSPTGDLIHNHGHNSSLFVGEVHNVVEFWKKKLTFIYVIYNNAKEKKKEQIVVKFSSGEKYRLNSNFLTDKKTDDIIAIIITITKETIDENDIIAGLAV